MLKKYNVAILGATGVVGKAILEILAEIKFPCDRVFALASHRSEGDTVLFKNKPLLVKDVASFDFSQVQIAFFSAGASVSARYVPIATKAGCVVIDNTSMFRQQKGVPLLIPEVNKGVLPDYKNHHLIANPNCSTIQMLVALKPIYDAVGISRINVATYQSVSGTGKAAIEELAEQTRAIFTGKGVVSEVYPVQIAFNAIPQIDSFEENGYTREEMKMVNETKKILDDEEIKVNPTAVRVPVFFGHAAAIHIETKAKITAKQAYSLLSKAPGVVVNEAKYPTAAIEGSGKDGVFVGRIREDISHPLGLNLWVVADNIRKGAALNSVQIAKMLIDLLPA